MMNRKFRNDWVEDLRHNEYRKGRGRLYNPYTNRYCALGRACVVAGIPINTDGSKCVIENDNGKIDGYEPLQSIGIDTVAVFELNDFGNDREKFTDVIDYLNKQEVVD